MGMKGSIYISRRVAEGLDSALIRSRLLVKAGSSCLPCTPGQARSGIQLLTPQGPNRERGTGHQAGTLQKCPGAERRVAPYPVWDSGPPTELESRHPSVHQAVCLSIYPSALCSLGSGATPLVTTGRLSTVRARTPISSLTLPSQTKVK